MLTSTSPRTIAIIGAGASGTLLAAQLLRATVYPLRIYLIEARPLIGRGVAYGTTHMQHLLNVPVGKMSAYSELPNHFLSWLTRYAEMTEAIAMPDTTSFVPRSLYGSYLQEVLQEAQTASTHGVLELIHDEVLDVHVIENGLEIVTKNKHSLYVHQAILATGYSEPLSPFVAIPEFYSSKRYSCDPWTSESIWTIAPTASVLLLGSSLTMIDVALALKAQEHVGTLFAVSRRGVVPYAHQKNAVPGIQLASTELPTSLHAVVRWVRAKSEQIMQEADGDWRSVVDALRPHTQTLWQSWSIEEKQQFLRHVQLYWDARRHRIAPIAAREIEQMRATAQLQVYAGRVQRYDETDNDVGVTIRLRHTQKLQTLHVHHVINCTGPNCDIRKSSSPLLSNLFAQGVIRPDACYLGIDTTANGAIIDRNGVASSRLYTLGPLRKGTLWESTAIPEIRGQAAQLAHHLLHSSLSLWHTNA